MSMYTDRSRKVFELSAKIAKGQGCDFISTWHLLYGLAIEGSGVASNSLRMVNITTASILEEATAITQEGGGFKDSLQESPRLKKAIEEAFYESVALKHEYIGTEHLLLGLIKDHENTACRVIKNLGVNPEDLRTKILNFLGSKIGLKFSFVFTIFQFNF